MNLNLIRCALTNQCKSRLLTKYAYNNTCGDYQKIVYVCQCPTVSYLTTYITSTSTSNQLNIKENGIGNVNTTVTTLYKRFCSSDSKPASKKLPPLMQFPQITWPSLIKSFRNFILTNFIIKPYLDRDFNLPDFVKGSKIALEVVSKKISEGDVKSLNGLVSSDIVPNIQKALSIMNLSQREQLSVAADDIYFSFPYQVQIGIIFSDDENDQRRFVEITMVYHILRGLSIMRSRGEEPPINMGMLPEYQTRISICNYRFIREFTKGVDGDWSINLLNHFKPSDELIED